MHLLPESLFFFPFSRFNHSVVEDSHSSHETESDIEEEERPSFSSIAKATGFLDKELAASGFTRREQEQIESVLFTSFCGSYIS